MYTHSIFFWFECIYKKKKIFLVICYLFGNSFFCFCQMFVITLTTQWLFNEKGNAKNANRCLIRVRGQPIHHQPHKFLVNAGLGLRIVASLNIQIDNMRMIFVWNIVGNVTLSMLLLLCFFFGPSPIHTYQK